MKSNLVREYREEEGEIELRRLRALKTFINDNSEDQSFDCNKIVRCSRCGGKNEILPELVNLSLLIHQVTNSAVKEWMQMLKDILFNIDEIVDDFATEALQRQVEVHGNKLKEKLSLFHYASRVFNASLVSEFWRYIVAENSPGLGDLPALEELSIDDCEYLHFTGFDKS
ncbi:hypothetical protein LguiB_033412 [Lonicera macranthoides]